jgi:hypothetical protein
MRTSSRGVLSGLALAALLSLAPAAHAQVVSASVTLPTCVTFTGGTAGNCTDTGFLDLSLAGANSEFIGAPAVDGSSTPATFTSAFDSWNAANGGAWTLMDGGTLDVSINVYIGVSAGLFGAGLNPVVFTVAGSEPTLADLVWTQALVVNYTALTPGPLAAPIETLDTFSLSEGSPGFPTSCVPASSGASPPGGAFCDPIYPFQYGDTLASFSLDGIPLGVDPFFDAPSGLWPNASFDAVTLLSAVTAPDTLTVYQGVEYGFTLSTPEPPTWALLMAALPGLLVFRRWSGSTAVKRAVAAV